MKIVFLAGPFEGDRTEAARHMNTETAERFARLFIEHEIPFYSPHMNIDRLRLVDYQTKDDFSVSMNAEMLKRSDALAVLPGWELSLGTKREIAYAEEKGIPVFYLEKPDAIDDIRRWLSHDRL